MFWHSKIRIVATQEVRLCHLRLLATKLIDQILCQSLYSYLSKIYNFFFQKYYSDSNWFIEGRIIYSFQRGHFSVSSMPTERILKAVWLK